VNACAIHISDLHRGTREAPALDDALVTLCHELSPELVIASGDLSNRGRVVELEQAKALLDLLPAPTLAVPGNHDLPYTLPARITRPWDRFALVFGTTDPVLHTASAVVCGLNSARAWRHQGGRLDAAHLEAAATALRDTPADALRVVVCHHHLAGAPWRASRKFPLKQRDKTLRALAAAGVELVLGGHIHQSTAVERHAFEALEDDVRDSLVLATAPGFGRPRPHRLGEANGLHIVRWTATEIVIETRIWRGGSFEPTGAYRAPRLQSPTRQALVTA
jgi:3',5'-cyclic AMP phosphodiesterase CpdA